jgi:hypothetical protein
LASGIVGILKEPEHIKSPFVKGGFRGIYHCLNNPSVTPFEKRGQGNPLPTDSCKISFEAEFLSKLFSKCTVAQAFQPALTQAASRLDTFARG